MADPYIKRNNIFPTESFRKATLKPKPPSRHEDRRAMSPEQNLQRVKSLQTQMRAHMKRAENMWIGQETARLMNKRITPKLNHPPPRIAGQVVSAQGMIAKQARQNVRARMTKRLTGLAEKRASLEQQIKGPEQKRPAPQLKQAFRQKVKQ